MKTVLIVDGFPASERRRQTRDQLRRVAPHVRPKQPQALTIKRPYRGRAGLRLYGREFRITGRPGEHYRRRIRQQQTTENPWCRYCGIQVGGTLDHATPYSRGGGDEPSNLILCCRACNEAKGAATLAEWRDWLRQTLANVEALLRAQDGRH